MIAKGWADSAGDPSRAEPEGKGGADFYANICETLCHGEASHTRGMSAPPPSSSKKEEMPRSFLAEHPSPNSVIGATREFRADVE